MEILFGLSILSICGLLFYIMDLKKKRREQLLELETLRHELSNVVIEKETCEKKCEKAAENIDKEIEVLRKEFDSNKKGNQNTVLQLKALQLATKNEVIQSVNDLKEKAKLEGEASTLKILTSLTRDINSNLSVDGDWETFREIFENEYKGFFSRLQNKRPGLTSNDLRMCSYIMIGLDTKEISRILDLTVNAVEKRRYRLRKKLELEPSDNINDFFASI